MAYRLGVDVGGTFTDLVLINDATGEVFRAKVASTPTDQSQAVFAGIEKICSLANISASEIVDVTHGATVATNALLEGKGCKVGLVVTEGYRQILQVGRSYVPGGLAGWIIWPKPEPLASLENTCEVSERISARGEVVRPLDKAGVSEALRRMKESKVQALAVSLINSYASPVHESALRNARYEMDAVVFRTAMSPGIREQHDEFPLIADRDGRMVVGQFGSFIAGFLDSFEGTIEQGDLFLTSNPYQCDGAISHSADRLVLLPIYY